MSGGGDAVSPGVPPEASCEVGDVKFVPTKQEAHMFKKLATLTVVAVAVALPLGGLILADKAEHQAGIMLADRSGIMLGD